MVLFLFVVYFLNISLYTDAKNSILLVFDGRLLKTN